MIYFIVPSYNEAQNIPELVQEISSNINEAKYEIIIIDDGSSDNTTEVIDKLSKLHPVRCVKHKTNKGVGQAFRTGFSEILKTADDNDIVITKEADNTSDPKIIKDMIENIQEGNDIVLASCYASSGGIEGTNLLRVITSSAANLLLRTAFPIKGVCTYSSFYRAYKVPMLKNYFKKYGEKAIQENGFACMVEMLVKVHQITRKIKEVPMILKGDLRKGKSKMRVIRTIADYLKLIVRLKCQLLFAGTGQSHVSVTAESKSLDRAGLVLEISHLKDGRQSKIQEVEAAKSKTPTETEIYKS